MNTFDSFRQRVRLGRLFIALVLFTLILVLSDDVNSPLFIGVSLLAVLGVLLGSLKRFSERQAKLTMLTVCSFTVLGMVVLYAIAFPSYWIIAVLVLGAGGTLFLPFLYNESIRQQTLFILGAFIILAGVFGLVSVSESASQTTMALLTIAMGFGVWVLHFAARSDRVPWVEYTPRERF